MAKSGTTEQADWSDVSPPTPHPLSPNWKNHLDMERWLMPMDDFYTMKDILPGRVTN